MSDFGQRLKAAIKNAGMTQAELADAIGIKQQSVQYLCSGKPRSSKHITKIAAILQTTPEWLELGISDEAEINERKSSYAPNPTVPVFALRELEGTPAKPLFSIACPTDHSARTYGAIVPDNTMQSSTGPCYPEGSVIFIDPERAQDVRHGDLVVFRLTESGVIGFKRLVDNDTGRGLEPLNARYPWVPAQPFEIIGMVIGCWVPAQSAASSS